MEKLSVRIIVAVMMAACWFTAVSADVLPEPSTDPESIIGYIVAGVLVVTLGVYKFFFSKKKKK